VRVGYLGPPGTNSEEALRAVAPADAVAVALPTIYDTVMAVAGGAVERALVPIENSLEGSVNATLDAIAVDAEDVVIVGETVHPIRTCLIAREVLPLSSVEVVVSHPQASGQCARFIRTELTLARVVPADSTADAVRIVSEASGKPWVALGTRLAAELYGCAVLKDGVEDVAGNETRFVWLARADAAGAVPGGGSEQAAWKTSVVFWGGGDEEAGWLVRCLSELAFRGVNLTKIESRPRKLGLGHYMFFLDMEGRNDDPAVAAALDGLRALCDDVRALGSYPAA